MPTGRRRPAESDLRLDASRNTAGKLSPESVRYWPKMANSATVNSTITTRNCRSLGIVLDIGLIRASRICAELRGGAVDRAEQRLPRASDFSRMPWLPYWAWLVPINGHQ